ncbi:unnamed protein product, partial [Tenebrio molitor]
DVLFALVSQVFVPYIRFIAVNHRYGGFMHKELTVA